MHKPVAIIILNYNTPVHTANCLKSLNAYCDQTMFDIVVADNGSNDGSLALLRLQFPQVVFIDNSQNLGFAEGNNRGLEYSLNSGYLYSLLINSDTLVDEDIITPLTAHLNLHENAAAVQPAIYWLHKQNKLWNGPGYFNKITGNTVSRTADRYQSTANYLTVEWATGCCVLLRNEALKLAGLFNKQFFLYYEDVELCFRLRRHGYEVHYLPAVKMYHEAGVSGKSADAGKEGFLNPIIHYYTSRNHLWFLRRYGSAVLLPLYLVYNLAYYLILFVYFKVRGRNQKASCLLKGLKEGLFTSQNAIWPDA